MFSCLMILLALNGNTMTQAQKAQALAMVDKLFAQTIKRDAPQIVNEKHVTTTPKGLHVWLKRSYQNIPFVEAQPAAVHLDSELRVIAYELPVPVVSILPQVTPSEELLLPLLQEVSADHGTALQLVEKKPYYFVDTVGAWPRLRLVLAGSSSSEALWVDVDPRSLQIVKNFAPNLSATGQGQVWRRNPVAAAQGLEFGPNLINVDLEDLDGSGYLRGAYVDIPTTALYHQPLESASRNNIAYTPGMAFEPSLQFHYDPSDLRFEEVSVYYWITAAQHFLQDHGFHIREYPILVQPHWFGSSNATYFTGLNFIGFGDGVIDTAEDADIVVHEYGHAILDDLVGESFYNDSGAMFHEGFADFFSYLVTDSMVERFGPDRYPELLGEMLGSYRSGSPGYERSLLHPGHKYPYLHNEPHKDGQLWSSLFFELSEEFGADWVTHLLFETLNRANSARPDVMAKLLLDINRELFSNVNAERLRQALEARGFLGTETADLQVLAVGHELVLEEGELWGRFQVNGTLQPVALKVEPLDVGAYYSFALAKNHLPTNSEYDTLVPPNGGPWSTVLAVSGTRPTLEEGAVYYFKLSCDRPVRIRLLPASPATLPELAADMPQQLAVSSNAPVFFRIRGLNTYSRILIDPQISGNGLYMVSLAADAPYTYEDAPNGEILALESQSGPLLLDLSTYFPNVDEIYLTVDSRYYGLDGTGVITWTGVGQRDSDPRLEIDEAHLVQLTPYDRDWYFDLAAPAPALKISTDATHPFNVEVDQSQGLAPNPMATLQDGVYTVILNPDNWVLQAQSILTSFQVEPGRYRIEIAGADWGSCPIQIQVLSPPVVPTLPESGLIKRSLLPNELLHYHFKLPAWAQDIRIQQMQLGAEDNITVFIHQHEPYNNSRLPYRGTLEAKALLYRASAPIFELDPYYNREALFLPGVDYELWFYNSGTSPVGLDAQVSFSNQLPLVPDLANGMRVQIPTSGFEYLFQDQEYQVPFRINPPPGTKRVVFSFDELRDADRVLLTTQGLDQRAASRPLYQVVLDRNELRFDPEHPFIIYFNYAPTYPGSPEPSFRVHISYHFDSNMNGVITPDQPVFEDGLPSSYPLPLALQVPPDTRKIELAWLPLEKPLDVKVRLQAQPGRELPSDVSVLDETLFGGRSDFSLSGKTPYEALPDENWTVRLRMPFAASYYVGFFPGALPFPFKLAARYSSLDGARDFSIPSAIGSTMIEDNQFRVVNPGRATQSATWRLAGKRYQVEISPKGFIDIPITPGSTLHFEAEGPLLVFQAMRGAGWLSLAGTPAVREATYLLPHISPDSSDWRCYLDCIQAGVSPLTLNHSSETEEIQPGLSLLSNQEASSTWRRLNTGLTADGLFQETTLSAVQFWQNGTQVVQDFPHAKGSSTYFVPHLPDNPDWWSGLVLSNPGDRSSNVTLRAFANGQPIPQVFNLTLAPGESKAGLMDQFVPEGFTSSSLSWMRIDATDAIVALSFIGDLRNVDTAGFSLPDRDGRVLVFSGSLNQANHGWALVNTVNQKGSVVISAYDREGHVEATLTHYMQPYDRYLFLISDLGLTPGQDYLLRIESADLRLVGLQLDVNGAQLAGEVAQVIE